MGSSPSRRAACVTNSNPATASPSARRPTSPWPTRRTQRAAISSSWCAAEAMMPELDIAPLAASAETVAALADLLIETVASGASVTFMHPLAPKRARRFWEESLAAAARGERVVLGARADGRLAGTVTLSLDMPDNQQHRAEISKLMTALAYRHRGIARALMTEAERIAAAKGRILITLDT